MSPCGDSCILGTLPQISQRCSRPDVATTLFTNHRPLHQHALLTDGVQRVLYPHLQLQRRPRRCSALYVCPRLPLSHALSSSSPSPPAQSQPIYTKMECSWNIPGYYPSSTFKSSECPINAISPHMSLPLAWSPPAAPTASAATESQAAPLCVHQVLTDCLTGYDSLISETGTHPHSVALSSCI